MRATVSDAGANLAIVMPEIGSLPARAYQLDLNDLEKTVSIVYSTDTYGFRPLPRTTGNAGDDAILTGNDWEVDIDRPIGHASVGLQDLRKKVQRTTTSRKFQPWEPPPPGDTVVIDRDAQLAAAKEGRRATPADARGRKGTATHNGLAKRRSP